MRSGLCFWLVATVLQAQQISGKVVNSISGEPIKKAFVILRAENTANNASYAAETDGNGRFASKGMAPGSYVISAQHQGYQFKTRGATGAPPPPTKLVVGQIIDDLVLRLSPMGVITGKVLDEDGDPVRDAQVRALIAAYVNGKKRLSPANQGTSNDKGEYRLFNLAPGTVYLQAWMNENRMVNYGQPQEPVRGSLPPEKPMPAYFPGVADEASAVPIEVTAGAQLRGYDIRLVRQRVYSVHIKLPTQPGPGHYFYAQVASGLMQNRGPAYNFQNDSMEIPNLAPGSYVITIVQVEGQKRSYALVPVEIVNANVDAGSLAFAPPLDVAGVVVADDKKPHPWEKIRVGLSSDGGNGNRTMVGSDATFTLRGVVPDSYRINIGLTGPLPDAYVKSVRIGDHELVDWQLDLTKESGPLTILLGTDVGHMEGSVKNAAGEPSVRSRVNMIPEGNLTGRSDQTKFTFSDEKGEFNFKSVAPGQYRIFAWEDVEQGRPQDPAFRKRFEKQSVLVKIESNGHEKVEVTAIPAADARKL